jgi:hypothetical protein
MPDDLSNFTTVLVGKAPPSSARSYRQIARLLGVAQNHLYEVCTRD